MGHLAKVARVTLALALLLPAGAASGATPDRPLWAGDRFEELPLDRRGDDPIGGDGVVTFLYGTAEEGSGWPLEIQNWSLCDRHPLEIDVVPERIFERRGVPVVDYGEGRLEVLSSRTNAVVFGLGDERAVRVVDALRPEMGDPGLDAALPPARLPRWVLRELKLVRAVARRSGTAPAARRRLGISRAAIRFRLRLADALAPGALGGVRAATATPGQVIRERRALIEVEEGVEAGARQRRRAARHRARVRRC